MQSEDNDRDLIQTLNIFCKNSNTVFVNKPFAFIQIISRIDVSLRETSANLRTVSGILFKKFLDLRWTL